MKLDEKQCSILMNDAFKRNSKPEYTVENVNKVFVKMPTRVAEVVFRKTNDNLTYAQLSSMLNISVTRVGQLYNTGLNFIRYASKTDWFTDSVITSVSSIATLGLSCRAYNALCRGGCKTVGDVVKLSYDDLRKIRNAGKATVDEIITVLNDKGFKIKDYELFVEINKPKSHIVVDSNIAVVPEMLDKIYNKCLHRVEKYGKVNACITCPYKCNANSCMFNPQPIDWVVTEIE